MATLPITSASSMSSSFKRPSSSDTYSLTSPLTGTSTSGNKSLFDRVELGKDNSSSHGILSSYVELLQQQRRAQSLFTQALSGSGEFTAAKNSVLTTYQTLEYEQNSYDKMYNLKKNRFQSSLDISV
jgi:beta-mannanase